MAAPGPVSCQIRHKEDGTVICETHGVDLTSASVEEIRAHIEEANEQWRAQQMFLEGLRVTVTPDLQDLMKKDPEKAAAALMGKLGEYVDSQKTLGETLSKRVRVLHINYKMTFPGGDELTVHFEAGNLDEMLNRLSEIREKVRADASEGPG